MNWTIAIVIWVKGLMAFAIPCILVFPIGIFALPLSLTISWIAIPVYACILWLLKQLRISHKPAMALMLTVGAAISVIAALYLYKTVDSSDEYWGFDGITFWIPMVCCMLSIVFSNNSIFCYLDTASIDHEFIIE